MIITKVDGGLGNQMFKYAHGFHVARTNATDLKLDLSWFENIRDDEATRKYGLGIFSIYEDFATEEEVESVLKKHIPLLKPVRLTPHNFYVGKKIYKDVYLDGQWQSEKYFKGSRDAIIKQFTLKSELQNFGGNVRHSIEMSESVSLHIRRTDYVTTKKHKYHQCDLEYYNSAIKKITEVHKNIEIFVFSDDMRWTKEHIVFEYPTHFVEGYKDYEDIFLMSLCKHNVIANSSFSWWGAWLSQHKNKITIAPKHWFADKKRKSDDIIPPDWITL